MLNRAYSTFEIKSVDEEHRVIRGIATTPSPDRVGDIVEPSGAEFKLPLPLLWQHNSSQPIGHVVEAKVTKNGIEVVAKLVKIDEAGNLKDRLDEAWQSIKSGLVRGFSIGFKSLEDADIKGTYGVRFIKWLWLELSAVTIPANGDCSIQAIKSVDQDRRAALGEKPAAPVRAFKPSAGVAAINPQRKSMSTIKERIKAFEATRQAKAAEMKGLMDEADKAGTTLDGAQQEQYDTLSGEIKEIDAHLKRLSELDAINVDTAQPVADNSDQPAASAKHVGERVVPAGSGIRVTSKLEPGAKFARMAICVARAKWLQKEGRFLAPDEIYKSEKHWMDSAPDVHLALKSAVNGLDSTTSAAASQWAYAQNIADFVEYLRPRTLVGRIPGFRRVPFNIRLGGMDGGSTGYWVGQGLAVPVSKPTSTSISLGITKVGGICVITKELAMLSTPSAEMMVRDDLARAIQQKADTTLIDPNNGGVANVTPQSLTYGATPRQASGTDFAAFKADWKTLTANFYSANIPLAGAVAIMKEELAEALALMVTSLGVPQFPSMQDWANGNGRLMGCQVFTTQAADTSGSPDFDNMLVLLQPNEVLLADDGGASVEASDQVSIEMDDAPGNKSTPTATGASMVSMFQTESIAIKGIRHVNWTKRRSAACQYIRSAAYV
jgi:HK97 family phage prohead protease